MSKKDQQWTIRVRQPGFNRVHGPFALRFVESEATTDKADAAKWAKECGYTVLTAAEVESERKAAEKADEEAEKASAEVAEKSSAPKK